MNEFFIYLEDITVNPGYLKEWRIIQMTALALGPNTPSKNSCSRQLRIVNAVVWTPASQIDWPKSVFLQTKATHFETMMTTVAEVNRDKTKVPDYFFRNVSLVCFTAELQSMSKMIHNRCTCKLIIKTLRIHTCMQTNNYVLFYVLIRYSLLFSSEIILKQLFASGSVNIVE